MSKSVIAAYTILFSSAALGAIYGWLLLRDMMRQPTFAEGSVEEAGDVVGMIIDYMFSPASLLSSYSPWFEILFIASWSGIGITIAAIPIGLTAIAWHIMKARSRLELTKKKLHRELSNQQSED